ncbi:HNH endonuclease, partial [Cupriavidus sp. KB_39]|uniref:HNH endonuclease n=1 Tax=Cupriavidus sp. KB_39 TaxID=3233036 RepID=UPI003F8FC2A3
MESHIVACIFCGNRGISKSRSHIIPESLGGPHSPIAPFGITCDGCNQYFGQKVESFALRSFPFIGYRLLESIPSKKNRMVSIPSTIGVIRASGTSGKLELEPRSPRVAQHVVAGHICSFRFSAEVTDALAVCRMLLKIGLELLGKHFYEVAISERVRRAREFARRPRLGERWWFIIHSDPSAHLSN